MRRAAIFLVKVRMPSRPRTYACQRSTARLHPQRWKYLQGRNWRSGVTDLDRLKAAEMAEAMQARKDKKLAESDTRRWCVDRCLSTGHCEAVEDILRMTTKQVMAFCQECADEEGCDLDFRKANEYMEDLSEAAWTAENAAG